MIGISHTSGECLKKSLGSRALGLLIGALGLYIVLTIWIPMAANWRPFGFFDIFFLFTFPIPVTLVGIYFLHTAGHLWRGLSSKGLRKASVCLAFLLAAMALLSLSRRFPDRGDSVWTVILAPLAIALGGLFYLAVKHCLFKWFALSEVMDYAAHRRATKVYLGVFSLAFWTAIANTTELLPSHPDYEYVPANDWLAGLIVFGSIPLAFGCYRLGLRFFLKLPPDRDGNNGPAPESVPAGSDPADDKGELLCDL